MASWTASISGSAGTDHVVTVRARPSSASRARATPMRRAAADDQDPASEAVGELAKPVDGAAAEHHLRRRRELESNRRPRTVGHRSESAGKTLANFTLDRGSAIMSATASRQT